ncbi:hypothetical protein KKB43_01875 [Patescibacteria group bacterium]|nr:hypothetical protein [Patescibacteria group bacterium]
MNKKTILAVLLLGLVLIPGTADAVISATNVNANFEATTFMTVVENIADFVIAFITILGIIFIVWGAIQYVTAGGDEGAMEKAKTTITYALIGLFVAAMAFALETLVLETLLA